MTNMSKAEYDALFGRKSPTDNGGAISTNGDSPELSDEEVEKVFTGYSKKFVKQDWQTLDIIHLLRYADQHGVNTGTANWSEMGAYKTSTGLWLAERRMQEAQTSLEHQLTKPSILIITTKAGKGTFFEAIPEILPEYTLINIETQKLSVMVNGQLIPLPKTMKFVPKQFDMPVICLAHYDIFSRSNRGQFETDEKGDVLKLNGKIVFKPFLQADWIAEREWDYVWCDEFHRLKDRQSKWTVNIKKIKTRYGKHGSTGTGFINRPDEIWSLLNWLHKEEFGSYWKFREEFCEIEDWDGYAKVVGCKPEKKDEFREIVRTIGVRKTLDEVMPYIKQPIFMPIEVELNPIQRQMYNSIRGELQALDQKGTPLYAANVLSLLQRLRQICVGTPEVTEDYYDPMQDRRVQKIKLVEPSSKIDALMEVLEGLQWDEDRKEPLVVFSCFKDPLELFKARLDKHNETAKGTDWEYKYIHMDVNDNDEVRYRKWHDDFASMQYRIFMSTLQLGGESINLTPARHIVFLDRSWSPKDNAQGIGRVRRPGQEGQPVVIHINAKNTSDQHIERVNQIKQDWFNTIFGAE